MAIKDAIERTSAPPLLSDGMRRNVLIGEEAIRKQREIKYIEAVIEAGKRVLADSDVLVMLDELRKVINSGDGANDARTSDIFISPRSGRVNPSQQRFQLEKAGAVSTGIGWNYDGASHNLVRVIAFPLTEEIVVEGRIGSWLFPKSTWGTRRGKKAVEEKIVLAYKSPIRVKPPVRV